MSNKIEYLKYLSKKPVTAEAVSFMKTNEFILSITQLLEEVLYSEFLLSKTANNSIIHPNGFYKIVLWEGANGERIRLHYWNSKKKINSSDIHDHFWDFSSRLLFGGLQASIYKESLTGTYFYNKYNLIKKTNNSHDFKKIGRKTLTLIDSNVLKKNDTHYLINTKLHKITNDFNFSTTATLVLQAPPVKNNNHIYTNRRVDLYETVSLDIPSSCFVKTIIMNTLEEIKSH